MNPIVFAMRHPITVMVALAGVLVASGLALLRMRIDIFPNLNLPVVYVVQPYGGMDPGQMEGLLTFHYENHFLYISGIHHIESQQHPGLRPDEDFLPSGHQHGSSNCRGRRPGQPRLDPSCRRGRWRPSSFASIPAAFRSATSCCPARPRASTRSRRPPTSAFVPPSSVCRACRRRRRSAAISAPSSSTSIRTSCEPTICRPTTWSPPSPPATPSVLRGTFLTGFHAPRAGQRDGGRSPGTAEHSYSIPVPTFICAIWAPSRTPPTSAPVSRWSTAAALSTSW